MSHFIVIGAGQAGQSIVTTLRGQGFDGAITLIGEEPVPPYQRPPLSKAYLLGEMELDRLFLRPESYYADENITLRTGTNVTRIDPIAKTVSIGDEILSYDKLALTTGSAPRLLPATIGGDLGGVYTMRTLADADAIEPEFREGASVLIVGGGYIGLEAAAVAAKKVLRSRSWKWLTGFCSVSPRKRPPTISARCIRNMASICAKAWDLSGSPETVAYRLPN
jgi:NAD(P)H-nitrite reductase